jgi:hypothetical protein
MIFFSHKITFLRILFLYCITDEKINFLHRPASAESQDFFPKIAKKTLSSGNNPALGLLNYISRV